MPIIKNEVNMNRLKKIREASKLKNLVIAKCLDYQPQSIGNLISRADVTDRILLKFCNGYIMHLKSELAAMALLEKELKGKK